MFNNPKIFSIYKVQKHSPKSVQQLLSHPTVSHILSNNSSLYIVFVPLFEGARGLLKNNQGMQFPIPTSTHYTYACRDGARILTSRRPSRQNFIFEIMYIFLNHNKLGDCFCENQFYSENYENTLIYIYMQWCFFGNHAFFRNKIMFFTKHEHYL